VTKVKILYIGNKLLKHGMSATSIETLGPLLENEGYEIFYSSDKKNLFYRLTDMLYAVWRHRKRVKYVIIDTYSKKSFHGAVVVSVLCRLLNVKYVNILHGGDLPVRLNNSPKTTRVVFNNAYKLVAPSGYLKYEFEKLGYKPVLIPNNINIGDYIFKHRSSIKPKILYVRSFASIYNPEMAIRVLNRLIKIYPDAELCMVGPDKDGTLASCKNLAIHYGIEKCVRFTGVLSKQEWHKLSEEYDIFINTTNVDNTPISVIEAMALGLPVVSTNAGGLPYLLNNEEDALLIDKGSVNGMVSAIKRLIENSELTEKISLNGRKKAESFDWEKVKVLWNDLLNI